MPPSDDLSPLLQRLHELAGGRPIYLVGGSVRDLLLGRPVKDLDFALPGPVEAFGQQVARALRGSFFYLRQGDETARIVLKEREGVGRGSPAPRMQIDLVALHGGTIEADLRRRDFTVNAMGLDLSASVPALTRDGLRSALADPLGGWEDLQRGCIRRCTPESLPADPLRALRAVRLAASFGWEIEAETGGQIRETGSRLAGVSSERVRDELFLMLELPPAASMRALERLTDLHLLDEALRGPARKDGTERVGRLHTLYASLNADADDLSTAFLEYLEDRITPPRSRFPLVKLAALLNPEPWAGSRKTRPEGEKSADSSRSRLELSATETQFLRKVWRGGEDLASLPPNEPPPALTLHHLFRRYGDTLPSAVLYAASDREGGDFHPSERALLRDWFFDRGRYLPTPLLNGHDLMRGFGERGGRWLSELMDALAEAQACGVVRDGQAAWSFAREWKRHHEGKPCDGEDSEVP